MRCVQRSSRCATRRDDKDGAHCAPSSLRGPHRPEPQRHLPMMINKFLVGVVLAIAIGSPIAAFVGDKRVPQPTPFTEVRVPFLHGFFNTSESSASELASLERADAWRFGPARRRLGMRRRLGGGIAPGEPVRRVSAACGARGRRPAPGRHGVAAGERRQREERKRGPPPDHFSSLLKSRAPSTTTGLSRR